MPNLLLAIISDHNPWLPSLVELAKGIVSSLIIIDSFPHRVKWECVLIKLCDQFPRDTPPTPHSLACLSFQCCLLFTWPSNAVSIPHLGTAEIRSALSPKEWCCIYRYWRRRRLCCLVLLLVCQLPLPTGSPTTFNFTYYCWYCCTTFPLCSCNFWK
jgi:hypothetical protein